jgi:hypothetical protein
MKTTIDMAREAGIPALGDIHLELTDLKAFEALVRADEREACAKVCETEGQSPYATKHAAAAIRNRGNT